MAAILSTSFGVRDEHAKTSRCLATLDEEGAFGGVFAARLTAVAEAAWQGRAGLATVHLPAAAMMNSACSVHLGTNTTPSVVRVAAEFFALVRRSISATLHPLSSDQY